MLFGGLDLRAGRGSFTENLGKSGAPETACRGTASAAGRDRRATLSAVIMMK